MYRPSETYAVEPARRHGQWFAACPICRTEYGGPTERGLLDRLCEHMNQAHPLYLPSDQKGLKGHA